MVKDKVATVYNQQTEALNALNSTVLDELFDVFNVIDKDDEVRCVIVTGEGRSFVAGADIAEMSTLNPVEGKRFCTERPQGDELHRKTEKPVIAAVNGTLRSAAAAAFDGVRYSLGIRKGGVPDNRKGLGITPGFGGTQRLSKIVGPGNAAMLILTAQNIKADEALRIRTGAEGSRAGRTDADSGSDGEKENRPTRR